MTATDRAILKGLWADCSSAATDPNLSKSQRALQFRRATLLARILNPGERKPQ